MEVFVQTPWADEAPSHPSEAMDAVAKDRGAGYDALDAQCDAEAQWRPGLTREWCEERKIPRPSEHHPALRRPNYHRFGDASQPLNRKGWEELDCLDYGYSRVTGRNRMLVWPRDEAVNDSYHQELRNLNANTPSPDAAADYLVRLGYEPETWDEILRRSERSDSDHKLGAVIRIARGDLRPLGAIYHDVRRRSPSGTFRGKILLAAVRKTISAADSSDPRATKPHYFG